MSARSVRISDTPSPRSPASSTGGLTPRRSILKAAAPPAGDRCSQSHAHVAHVAPSTGTGTGSPPKPAYGSDAVKCGAERASLSNTRILLVLFPLLLALLSLWLYRATLHAGFVWDDRAAIVGNLDVHGETSGSVWRHDFWGADLTLGDSHKSYRPVTVLTYRLNHWLHGLRSFGYHLGNVGIYIAVVMSVFALALLLFDHWGVAASAGLMFAVHPVHVEGVASLVGRADTLCALLAIAATAAALLARGHSFEVTLPGPGELTSIQCAPSQPLAQLLLAALGLLLAAAASLSKETGLTVFGVLFLIEFIYPTAATSSGDARYTTLWGGLQCVYRRCFCWVIIAIGGLLRTAGMTTAAARLDTAASHPALLGTHPKKAKHLRYCRVGLLELLVPWARFNAPAFLRAAAAVASLTALLVARFQLHGGTLQLYQWTVMENHISLIPELKTRALSYAQTHWWYVFKLLYPRHLCFDYGYRCMPTVESLTDVRNALPLMAYGLGLAVLLRALRLIHHSVVPAAASDEAEELDASPPAPATEAPVDRAEAGRRGAGLLLCWLLVLLPLLPALNILFPVGALLAERLLFLPSVGFCIGGADLLVRDGAALWLHLDNHLKWIAWQLQIPSVTEKGPLAGLGPSGRGIPAALTLLLLPLALWHSSIVLHRSEDWLTETALFRSGLDTCPDSIKALNNHGMMGMAEGRLGEALAAYERARFLYPSAPSFHVNSGIVYQKLHRPIMSALMYEKVLRTPMASRDAKAHGYYGGMLAEWAAGEDMRRALNQEFPDDPAGATAAVAFVESRAEYHLDEAIRKGFHPPSLLHSRASLALTMDDHSTALHYLRAAIEENTRLLDIQARTPGVPVNDVASMANLFNQLGVALAGSDDEPGAIAALQEGLKHKDGAHTELVVNLSMLYRRSNDIEKATSLLMHSLQELLVRGSGGDGGADSIAAEDLSLAAALFNNLGLIQQETDRPKEARESFTQAMRCLHRLTDGRPESHPFHRAVADNLEAPRPSGRL